MKKQLALQVVDGVLRMIDVDGVGAVGNPMPCESVTAVELARIGDEWTLQVTVSHPAVATP